METKNPGFENSLRCLQHPLSLISIVLLLFNDHFLKIISPSWLTGKLSDFAGLFSFPFVVAAGLSLLLSKFNYTLRFIGLCAFVFVAIWFMLLKTFLPANSLTVQFASLLMGPPIKFILDPTDIIAIAVLFPAWNLWNHFRRSKPTHIALSIGAFAAIATSPREQTIYNVTDLSCSEDGTLYAADKKDYGEERFPVAFSRDGGTTWERFKNANEGMQYIDHKTFPVEYCKYLDYYRVTHCYRVTAALQFQYAFEYPPNTTMKFYDWVPVFRPGGVAIKAYDMMVVPCEDQECILVAIGEAGILRRVLPDGNWEIIEVLRAGSNEVFSNNP